MNLVGRVKSFCTPARLYVYISCLVTLLLLLQNIGSCGVYKAGSMECAASSIIAIFIGQGLYIAFWAIVLQGLCKAGYESLSWFVFLFPLVMFFVLMGLMMISAGRPRQTGGSQQTGRSKQTNFYNT